MSHPPCTEARRIALCAVTLLRYWARLDEENAAQVLRLAEEAERIVEARDA